MPNRLIKESIHSSDKVNAMTDFQFRLWINLITYVDDYGRGDARSAIIKGSCFPLRERITNKDIENALAGLAGIGCVSLYEVDGMPYLYFPNWEKHQSVRNKRSKYPDPNDLQAVESKCNQVQANAPVIQSNPKPNPNPSIFCAEPCVADSTPEQSAPPMIELPTNKTEATGEMYPVFDSDIQKWAELYPAVDVMQELRGMYGWLDANKSNRKTSAGMRRFINSWLSREQNKSRTRENNKPRGSSFADLMVEDGDG